MDEAEDHILRARQVRQLRNDDEVMDFERALGEVARRNSWSVDELWQIYDDECEMHEVMFGLVHLIESRPREEVVPSLLRHYGAMVEAGAGDWARRHLVRMLNDAAWRELLVDHLASASDLDSDVVRDALAALSRGRSPVAERAAAVVADLGRRRQQPC